MNTKIPFHSNTTLVSCFYNIYNKSKEEWGWRLQQFESLMKLNIYMVVFTDNDCYDSLCELSASYANHVYIHPPLAKEEWFTYQHCHLENTEALPSTRNHTKDTFLFMMLMNEKPIFVQRSVILNYWKTHYFGWIDFSIGYILKTPNNSLKTLQTVCNHSLFHNDSFLYIPGCWTPLEYINMDYLAHNVVWRFCGGFFIGSHDKIMDMGDVVKTHWKEYVESIQVYNWEVNYWAWLEYKGKWNPTHYYGDHNDSIFSIPLTYFTICLKGLSNKVICEFPLLQGYEPSNTCFVHHNGTDYLNCRYVNYWYNRNYHYCMNHKEDKIISKNLCINQNTLKQVWMKDESIQLEGDECMHNGLEDIRLFSYCNELYYIATQRQYSTTGTNQMVFGKYDYDNGSFLDSKRLHTPFHWKCEKNWCPLVKSHTGGKEQLYFIYQWYPMQIGIVNDQGFLEIITEYSLDDSFANVRGSSCFTLQGDCYLGLVHYSVETHPRQYYHMLVSLDKDTLKPLKMTYPFCFQGLGIEFCIGFACREHRYDFWVSFCDRDVCKICVDKNDLVLEKIVVVNG